MGNFLWRVPAIDVGSWRPLRRPGRPRLSALTGGRSRAAPRQSMPNPPTAALSDTRQLRQSPTGDTTIATNGPSPCASGTQSEGGTSGDGPLSTMADDADDADDVGSIGDDANGRDDTTSLMVAARDDTGDFTSQPDYDDTYTPALLDEVAALGLDGDIARDILMRLFAQSEEYAMFGLLSELPPELSPSAMLDPSNGGHARELALMLLAVGLQLDIVPLSAELNGRVELLIDTLRIESLKRIPMLAWKSSGMNVSQSLALLMASHTWSLKSGITEIAGRWNAMAGLIWHDLVRVDNSVDLSQTKALHLVGKAIELQQATLRLLHHEPHAASAGFQALTAGGQHYDTPCRDWEFTSPSASTRTDFFTLFTPLIQPLQKVAAAPLEPSASEEVRDGLEVYFLQFPVSLLEYRALKHAYQAEAMVWFHGIFMLTYVHRDLFGLLGSDVLSSTLEFFSAFDHSILLGEVLPTILLLDPKCQTLSAATTFFILLSSVITCVALREFHQLPDLQEAGRSPSAAPATLLDSADRHLQLLGSLIRGTRFDSDLINHAYDCLSSLTSSLTAESSVALHQAMAGLAAYQWSAGGHGVLPSPSVPAEDDWHRTSPALFKSRVLHDGDERLFAIQRLCSPGARICHPGCFELSIELF